MPSHTVRMATRWTATAALVLWIGLADAHATEMRAHAEQLFHQGRRALRQDRYAAAQTFFERSLGYQQIRNAYWNLAACHLSQGHRDLAVWALDRYMRMNPQYVESTEMQAALGAVADSSATIEDPRRGELANQINSVSEAIEEGRSTPATIDARRFGTNVPGGEFQRLAQISQSTSRQLFSEGHRLINEGRIQEALEFFERSLAYKPVRNALWNIAACHIALGHRDFALIFIDGYLSHTPQARENPQVQAVAGLIADEPPNIPNVDRRYELWDQFSIATSAALGDPRGDTSEGGS